MTHVLTLYHVAFKVTLSLHVVHGAKVIPAESASLISRP